MDSLEEIKKNALNSIEKAADEEALKLLKIEYLGRSGNLTMILRGLKDMPEAERRVMGALANALRQELEGAFQNGEKNLGAIAKTAHFKQEKIDISLPGAKIPVGHLHPLTKIKKEVEEIFISLGFEVVEGPEMEREHYAFDALNMPKDHPAREMWDTLWLEPLKDRMLLRPQTSSVQIRYMEKHEPPFRIIAPGRVFRYEATDVSHDIQFHQVEGLVVGEDISVANLKHITLSFFRKLFGKDSQIRLRPSFFPFVEPGFEVDISCAQCQGRGCSVCKSSGWLEVMGAGMVHPNVFKAVGYNPKLWRGFAFGVGLDRLAMTKYKIPDIRFFSENDIRFLRQF
ncbi:MAG: phenylalanine--tRNA ligase subunit alpha [Candidatus Niyogibacteria bacterium]|nr:phenylalanine--tRNA ligase subunit alpha [Candidatus Niyogibacteria bacterium]